MDIRSVTIGIPLNKFEDFSNLEGILTSILDKAKLQFSEREISIRTFRINLSPIKSSEISDFSTQQKTLGKIDSIDKICDKTGIRWFNIPFNIMGEKNLESFRNFALNVFQRYPKTFMNLIVTENNKIDFNAINASSKFIKDVSELDNSGYNNFRVGVSCNVKPDTPFFPFTFSSEELGFSVGLELPKEFLKIIESFKIKDLNLIRNEIIGTLTPKIKEIENICKNIEKETPLKFHGIDVSLAPYPEQGSSVAELLEKLGLELPGSQGTLFLTSYLTDILGEIIKRGGIKSTGFNGVMFSLLEDGIMERMSNNNIYSVDSLISYSSVCGCGLDMVPLPGDIFPEELASIILDIAGLSSKLNKPLGVRVLPIPGKSENEFTEFNMDFLYNMRIKKVKNLVFFNKSIKKGYFEYLNEKTK